LYIGCVAVSGHMYVGCVAVNGVSMWSVWYTHIQRVLR